MSSESSAPLPLASEQRVTLEGASQTILVAAVITLGIVALTAKRVGSLATLDIALLAASTISAVALVFASRVLRRALSVDGADLAAMFTSLRWLGLVFALKAITVVLTAFVVLSQIRRGIF